MSSNKNIIKNRINVIVLQRVTMLLVMCMVFFIMLNVDASQVTWGTKTEITVAPLPNGPLAQMQYIAYKDHYLFASGVWNTTAPTGSTGIRLIDLNTNTELPQPAVFSDIATRADNKSNLIVNGNYLYAVQYIVPGQPGNSTSSSLYYMCKIDVTDPTNPGAPVKLSLGSVSGTDISIQGDYLYLGVSGGIKIFNIAGNGLTDLGTTLLKDTNLKNVNSAAIHVSDGYIYGVNGSSGDPVTTTTRVFDIVKLSSPGTIDTSSWIRFTLPLIVDSNSVITAKLSDVYVEGNYAYIAVEDSANTSNNHVYILNISDKSNITYTTVFQTASFRPTRFAKDGNVLYVGCTGNVYVDAYDVSDLSNPIAMTRGLDVGGAREIITNGTSVIVVNKLEKVVICPVSIKDVIITSPTQGEVITTSAFTIRGTCKGATTVQLTIGVDTTHVTVDQNGNWRYDVSGVFTNGAMIIKADIFENSNIISSATKTINISIPEVIISDPTYSTNEMKRGNITANISITNPQGSIGGNQPVLMVMALFYDDKLVLLESASKTIVQGVSNDTLSTTITVPVDGDINKYAIQTFVWESEDSIKPLTDIYNFPIVTE